MNNQKKTAGCDVSDADLEKGTGRPIQDEGIGRVDARLRLVVNPRSLRRLAADSGVAEGTLRNLLKGGIPKLDTVFRIAGAKGLSPAWLATGYGPMTADEAASEASDNAVGVEFALIPKYDVEAAPGAGKAVQRESEVGRMAFRRDWLRQKGLSPKDLVMIRIAGDSMSPTIRDGSLALVDTRDELARRDGIYVLMVDGDLVAKRLQLDLAAGGVYIRSDNPAYREQRLSEGEAADLYIVGRVVWAGGEV